MAAIWLRSARKQGRAADAPVRIFDKTNKINRLTKSNKPFFAKRLFFYIQSTRYF
ncbi:hypothetical protein NEILACOT_05066 [Neisseria lactamica ATCC 23970]|uniref:Uncharacterized protein n=1 Tax=Neisseria lactamica ATCC 23970 TaxID=546265 RepID=D0WBY8_NEILA|nr:hypothetical protein NEILACOT_05066 [Neisseria lactamica ATCC 23970]